MVRFLLRKSLFGKLAEQPVRMHEPIGEREGSDGGRLVLLRSETNPRVRRWRKVAGQARVFYGEKARTVLREAMRTGAILLHRARLEDPEIRELVDHGLLEVNLEPAHHMTEYTARITKAGREYIKRIDNNRDRMARESQVTMFKGVRVRFLFDLRKAQQLGLFGGPPSSGQASSAPHRIVEAPERPAAPAMAAPRPPAVPPRTPAAPAQTVIPVSTDSGFTLLELDALRSGSGVVVPGHYGRVGGLPADAAGSDTKTVYRTRRYFYVTPKGAEPIPPVEVLTRVPMHYGKVWVTKGDPPQRVQVDGWRKAAREFLHPDGQWRMVPPEGIAKYPNGLRRTVDPREMEGTVVLTVPCDARCTEARGHKCECSCGGANHGAGAQLSYLKHTPSQIRELIKQYGQPVPAELRKAADGGAALHGLAPSARGLQLVTSKSNPRVKRWERTQEAAKPPSDHVRYTHPDTGEERTGQVLGGGAKGVTVVDHETGQTAKVHHGHYVVADPPNAAAEPAKKAPAKKPAAEKPAGEDWRGRFPGLNKYPPPEVKPDVGGADDDWKLRWRSPTTKKMVQAYETAYLRENAREKFRRINAIGAKLPELRTTLDTHLGMHPDSPAAVKAAMVRLVDHTAMRAGNEDSAGKGVHGVSTLLKKHVKVTGDTVHLSYVGKASVPQEHTVTDPKVAAVVKHLLQQPGDRLFQADDGKGGRAPVSADHLNDYVRTHLGEEHTLKDLRTFHATRLFSEAADKLGPPQKGEDPEEKVQAAALEVAKHLGHKKAMKRGHFAVHDGAGVDHDQVVKHGGKLYMHGERRAVGFHTAGEKKAYMKATGAGDLPKGEHPDVEPEWKHEPMTSLNNYIDPTVVEAYRRGLTLSGSLAKGVTGGDGLTADERRFLAYLGKVRELDPYKFRGGQP